MYWLDVLAYSEIADQMDRGEKRQLLAIATNPHLKAQHQKALWRVYQVRRDRTDEALDVLAEMKKGKPQDVV